MSGRFSKIRLADGESVLGKIVAQRRTHLSAIRELVANSPRPPRSARSLYHSLGAGERGGSRFIMECKAASPSLGMIREDYHPGQIASVYSRYAAGISVLCEPDFFGGSYLHLATVAASTHLPVLCKDFIVDEAQLYAARLAGADAALLMLSVLTDEEYARLADCADSLGLDVLTEVSDESEMARALSHGAKIIGINNRDLRDLSIDTGRTLALAGRVAEDTVLLSESGIRSHRDVRALAPHVSGFLVGSQLTGQPDIDAACRELLYGETKVCGITEPDAGRVAAASGALHGGIIAAAGSPRYVTAQRAAEIVAAAPELRWVLVSTAKTPAEVAREYAAYAEACAAAAAPAPSILQLHRAPLESADGERAFLDEVARLLPEVTLWRALSPQTPAGKAAAEALAEHPALSRFVCDSPSPGSGETHDWHLIPQSLREISLLAGGIGPENAAAARDAGFAGLDMNSRLEYPHLPGSKDPSRVSGAFRNLRSYPKA
ncbi:bifunctional indole-3-glycerol-phosphate synthase TrpC/phosphoribosylanthranilate isomerase TrpF [Dermabacteraceae bacterium P13095]